MTKQDCREKDHNSALFGLPEHGEFRFSAEGDLGIIFSVFAKDADSVFIVGSFNNWSESHPMKPTDSEHWQVLISGDEIRDGDTYKFKVYRNGEALYFADPCALENDGAPYYNSVYRDVPFDRIHTHENDRIVQVSNMPMNVYCVQADLWNGGDRSYSEIARELIPYMMQMGFTHLCLSGVFEEYYEFAVGRTLKASFAPRRAQGGIDGLRELVGMCHASCIGVIIDRGVTEFPENSADGRNFLLKNARYWIECYGFDGLAASAVSDSAAKELSEIFGLVRKEHRHACFVDRKLCGFAISGADAVLSNLWDELGVISCVRDVSLEHRARMVLMSYVLLSQGKGYTDAGFELGLPFDKVEIGSFEYSSSLGKKNAELQLFIADLNAFYLANSCLWDEKNVRNVKKEGNAIMVECCGEDGSVFFAADTSGDGCSVAIPSYTEKYIVLDSYSERHGGDKCSCPYKPVGERIELGPYGVILLVGNKKQGKNED